MPCKCLNKQLETNHVHSESTSTPFLNNNLATNFPWSSSSQRSSPFRPSQTQYPYSHYTAPAKTLESILSVFCEDVSFSTLSLKKLKSTVATTDTELDNTETITPPKTIDLSPSQRPTKTFLIQTTHGKENLKGFQCFVPSIPRNPRTTLWRLPSLIPARRPKSCHGPPAHSCLD